MCQATRNNNLEEGYTKKNSENSEAVRELLAQIQAKDAEIESWKAECLGLLEQKSKIIEESGEITTDQVEASNLQTEELDVTLSGETVDEGVDLPELA